MKESFWRRFPQQSDDITNKRTIRGHGRELLHIAFSDSFFRHVTTTNDEEKRYAGISTVDTLGSLTSGLTPEGYSYLKFEDGFARGEFEVEICVTSLEGPYVHARLRINVETNFQNLSMKLYSHRRILH
jgi:hypothetical protein